MKQGLEAIELSPLDPSILPTLEGTRLERAAELIRALTRRGLTLGVAESCTGGLLAKRLTDPPGASKAFYGGVIAYDNSVKREVLGVGRETLERYGAVSRQCAEEMAIGVSDLLGTQIAVSITGIAGPSGGSPTKPVGTVWVGLKVEDRISTLELNLEGDREEIREDAAELVLYLIRREI